MCLVVNKTEHPSSNPLVAEKDMLVVKGIVRYTPPSPYPWDIYAPYLFNVVPCYYTPYQHKIVKFTNGMCYMEEPDFGVSYKRREECLVFTGIHSLGFTAVNQGDVRLNVSLDTEEKLCYCPAIIPKGAKYYVGCNNDYVSDKLIVYNYFSYDDVEIKNAAKT